MLKANKMNHAGMSFVVSQDSAAESEDCAYTRPAHSVQRPWLCRRICGLRGIRPLNQHNTDNRQAAAL